MLTIDLRMLNASGIGTYLRNIVPLVIEAYPDIEISLLGHSAQLERFDWTQGRNIRIIDFRAAIYSVAEQFEILQKIPKETSLFWAPHYNVPLLYRGKMLVTIYDLFHMAMPELVGGLHKRLYARFMFNAVRKKAAAIITISRFTKEELVRLTGKGDENIYPIHLGVDSSWFNIKRADSPHGKPFLLCVGNIKPHKNLTALIRAFTLILDRIPHDLVVVGKKEGFITGDKEVVSEAAGLGERVHFTGYVEDGVLKQYFAFADVFVFPSLYEGFGLPPLEAMAAGCPVVVSNTASLPEIYGDAAIYCDPHSPADIAGKISQLLNSASMRESMRSRGLKHAAQFTWGKCGTETCKVIDKLIS